jgi:drug/metabolite transporter (DMT)-like permease
MISSYNAAHRTALTGALFCFISAVGFSFKSILIKLAYVYPVDASTLLTLRMAFSLPFFLSMAFWSGRRGRHVRLDRTQWAAIVGLGFAGYYLASYLDILGLRYISASFERLTLFLYPTIVVILSALLLKSRVTLFQGFALALSYAGIVLVFAEHLSVGGSTHEVWLGASLVFASAFIYSLYLIGSAEVVGKIGAVRFTAYAMTVACLLTFGQFLLTHPLSALALPHPVYWLTLVMAIVSTVLPAWLMAEALRRIGASQAAMVGSIGPIVTIVLGYFVLDEPITSVQLLGAGLVLCGVLLITSRPTLQKNAA